MALSANKERQIKKSPARIRLLVDDGLVHIYKGALLMYKAGDIGYVVPAADELTSEFAGIATEELSVAAADNTTHGTYTIEVIPRGSGELVEMDITGNITVANEGDPVYMDHDGACDLAAGVVHTVTNGLVGIIRQFISTNKAWVQLTQHPIL